MGAAVYTTTAIPAVTVLFPARNAEATVARAAQSLLDGTLQDLQLLAIDVGSTDATRSVLEDLAARDSPPASHLPLRRPDGRRRRSPPPPPRDPRPRPGS
ncbi:glycosyltransferase family 2 protein [Myxococcus guangdongensis]|uniref:glycosyltransferase family 2 protein n=1 Tax=Myxococcus guangdongensis TaxID=2906760 RepID=UPI002B20A017|nr:glycosyltransferase [Myxococcus guangdongensis]